ADGPQGVREEISLDSWNPAGWTNDFATAMPVGITLAASWDPELAKAFGKVIGEEARERNKNVMLGPGLNIIRTPICGRNYDYYGEDPYLSGRITVGYVEGMQGEQTVACIKHFAVNNQEDERGSISVEVDERTLREIYLPAFEAAVREGGALSIMGAYNKLRGQYCSENDYLLNQVLKKEWGFKGGVISDWGATHDTKEAALNGLDLEMGTGKPFDEYYLANPFRSLIQSGQIPMSVLDDKVRRDLRMLYASGAMDTPKRPGSINTKEHLDVALRAAEEGMVLLKNQGDLLPLDAKKYRTIAVIGDNAIRTFAAGGNSAGVKAFREITSLQGITARVGAETNLIYSQGYRQPERHWGGKRDVAGVATSELSAASPTEAAELEKRAIEAAKAADVVIFVGGLTHQSHADDEGTDRADLSLSAHQDKLIEKIVATNPRTVVVLIAGSPVTMPWLDKTPAVLQAWYGGSEAGTALAATLFGDVNPAGRLPVTFPKQLSDSPAHRGDPRQYPGVDGVVHYDEGLFVGYRWYDAKKIEPLFPFGFGLSYTKFSYSNLHVQPTADGKATVTLDVKNDGPRAGAEVVQFYLHDDHASVTRPEKELKAFSRVMLAPGETKTVSVTLNPRSFAYYSVEKHGWVAEAGAFHILVGASSRDIRLDGKYELAKTIVAE
ncbi:MAG TPA: glycoside hydrolase family 3 C-terminal domain-containing protein, partial [Opitutaceae bacterium]